MGQIYSACIYDIEDRTACVMDADKFHANCYSFCGTVAAAHYLLRTKPHNVMWGGDYIVLDDALEDVCDEKTLLGISTYVDYEGFKRNNKNVSEKPYYDRIKFIEENNKTWKRISVWDEAIKHFDLKKMHSVPYSGFLINQTKKQAVDLADYQTKAKFHCDETEVEMCIDPIPVLTELSGSSYSGGARMAYLNGVSAQCTPELASSWQGDLLQISDSLPDGFDTIDCCFADVWEKAKYCYKVFGLTDEGLIKNGDRLYEATLMNLMGKRSGPYHVKVEITDNGYNLKAVD